MISALVSEPDKDLTEFIAKLKGKSGDKSQPPAVTSMADYAIGIFTVPTTANSSSSNSSNKSSSSSKSNRQSSNTNGINGRAPAAPATPINVWQNPTPSPGGPSSPRRSPQKQMPPSLLQQPGPLTSPEKNRLMSIPGSLAMSSNIASISFETVTTSSKLAPSSALGGRGMPDMRPTQMTPSSVAGGAGSKSAIIRPPPVRLLQRPTLAPRTEPQPLPIVSSHMPNPSSTPVTQANSNNPASTTANSHFSTFHLWNPSPTTVLSKKEDFASVAAAGVVPNQQNQFDKPPSDEPTPTKNDPSKAPGYKPGLRTASPQMRPEQMVMNPAHMPFSLSEQMELQQHLGLRGPMPSIPGMPPQFGMPNPGGDGMQLPQHMPYLGGLEHPGLPFPLPHPSLSHLGPMPDQKTVEKYSTPTVPMTLPEIKSSLNPNTPDFRIGGIGLQNSLASGFVNGYPPNMGDINHEMMQGRINDGSASGSSNGIGGGANQIPAMMQYAALLRNMIENPQSGGDPEQLNQLMIQLQQQQQQQQQQQPSASAPGGPTSHGASAAPGAHLQNRSPEGGGSQSMYIGTPTNVSPMPGGHHRPSSAPSMPGKCLG